MLRLKGSPVDLNQLLSRDELDTYRRHMEAVAEDSDSTVSAEEMVRKMLHLLVTEKGAGNGTGGIHLGRKTVLPLLIEALVGPDPDPTAWMEAIAAGSFDLTGYKIYGTQGAKTGSPGNFLPRLLKRYEKAAGRPGQQSKSEAADLRTALCILIATTLLRELRNATNARAALGAAWPLIEAVSGRQHNELRKLIAHLGNEKSFLAHMAENIEKAVSTWCEENETGEILLRNGDVESHVRSPERVRTHLARQRSDAARREDALVEFGRLMLSGQAGHDDEVVARALAELSGSPAYADWRMVTCDTLPPLAAYLEAQQPEAADEEHYRRLRHLMPVAAGPSTPEQIEACALGAAHLVLSEHPMRVLGVDSIDRVTARVARKIFQYAWEVGPPPPAVPLAHLHWFQCSACLHSLYSNWAAREAWQIAGLAPIAAGPTPRYQFIERITELAMSTRLIEVSDFPIDQL